MLQSVWGPAIWKFFHAIAENIKDENNTAIVFDFFMHICSICDNLPCPECTMHATTYLSRINKKLFKTKTDLRLFLCDFHNFVNRRNKKRHFTANELTKYSNINVVYAFNEFAQVYEKSNERNLKLMHATFQHMLITKNIKQWLLANLKHFNYPQLASK